VNWWREGEKAGRGDVGDDRVFERAVCKELACLCDHWEGR